MAHMPDASHKQAYEFISAQRDTLARRCVIKTYQVHPEFDTRFGQSGRQRCLDDTIFHLSFLAAALDAGDESLFTQYATWANAMLQARGLRTEDLIENFAALVDVISEREREIRPEREIACSVIEAAVAVLRSSTEDAGPSTILTGQPHTHLARTYLGHLMRGERENAAKLISDAAQRGISVRDLYLDVFQPTQIEIGRLWQTNKITVAEEHYCSAATQLIMALLYPRILNAKRRGKKAVIAGAPGELHEIGARMVADFFEMDGWDGVYLGANTPISDLLKFLDAQKPDVLLVSATMTLHVSNVRQTIAAVRAASTSAVKILVGGRVFNVVPGLWQKLGADGYAPDAEQAVLLATSLFNIQKSP